MRRLGSTSEWCRFLEARDGDEAASEVSRHLGRLEDVYEEIAMELRLLASAPGGEVDEVLRVARSAVNEAIELLSGVVRQLVYTPPDEAA